MLSQILLTTEFLVLFLALPLGFRFSRWRLPALPVLWIVALYCWLVLRADHGFDRSELWNQAGLVHTWSPMMLLFGCAALLIGGWVWAFTPHLLFGLLRDRPWLWTLIMVAYPLLSVYPQELIYRAFLFHRYHGLFPQPRAMIVVSALAFALMHLVFRNWFAIGMTLLGGLIFAWRYQQTSSLLACSVEHTLYGCFMFTIGLGAYFYHGTYRLAEAAAAIPSPEHGHERPSHPADD